MKPGIFATFDYANETWIITRVAPKTEPMLHAAIMPIEHTHSVEVLARAPDLVSALRAVSIDGYALSISIEQIALTELPPEAFPNA